MPLETELAANTAALTAMTAALLALSNLPIAPRVSPPTAGENDVITDVPVKAPKAPKPAAASPQPATAAASPASEKKATYSATYEDVKAALMAVNEKHGRQLALDCLARVGVKNAKELDESMYDKALGIFAAALEIGSV